MTFNPVFIVAAAPFVLGLPVPAAAAPVEPKAAATGWATPWVKGTHDRVRLVAATRATGSAAGLSFGVEFRLDPAWKIFWRTPGDAGLPPHADWSASRNVAAVDVRWPRPVRFSEYGITSWGYRDRVILPLTVTPRRAGSAVTLTAELRYQVCKEICILGEARLSLTLPAGAAVASPAAEGIRHFTGLIPTPFAASDLVTLDVRAIRHGAVTNFLVTAQSRRALPPGLRAIVEAPSGVRVASVATSRTEAPRTVRLRFAARIAPPDRKLDGLPVTVTLLGDRLAVERKTRIEVAR